MTPLEKLKLILSEQYVFEDGDEYEIELNSALTTQQVDDLAKRLPSEGSSRLHRN